MVARQPIYRLVASHAAAFSHPGHFYHWFAATLVWLTDFLDAVDSWSPAWSPLRLLPSVA